MYQHNLYNDKPDKLEVFSSGVHYVVLESDWDGLFDHVYVTDNVNEITESFLCDSYHDIYVGGEDIINVVTSVPGYRPADRLITVVTLDKHPLLHDTNSELYQAWLQLEQDYENLAGISKETAELLDDVLENYDMDWHEFYFVYNDEYGVS